MTKTTKTLLIVGGILFLTFTMGPRVKKMLTPLPPPPPPPPARKKKGGFLKKLAKIGVGIAAPQFAGAFADMSPATRAKLRRSGSRKFITNVAPISVPKGALS